MEQETQTTQMEEKAEKPSAKQKSRQSADREDFKDPVSLLTEMAQGMDPQKIFSFAELGKGDFGKMIESNIQMMRAYDKIFQTWASGFSSRNQERIHTLEECVKCATQAEAMKLQNDCMQNLTKHWMTENQNLGSIFFDAFGKTIQENNRGLAAVMKKATERFINP